MSASSPSVGFLFALESGVLALDAALEAQDLSRALSIPGESRKEAFSQLKGLALASPAVTRALLKVRITCWG